jgi:glycosyltransferase involved in cell wall biosynthesis
MSGKNYPVNKKRVSVIIPCRNSGFTLLKTINSLERQTYKDFEIIIINDGSTEKLTVKILKIFSKNKKIRLYNIKNRGLAVARNVGIKYSSSEFVTFLDSDDFIAPNALKEYVKFLDENKDISFVYSNIVNTNYFKGSLKKNFNFFEQLFTNQIPYSICIRRIVYNKVGLYDENMPEMGFEDWEFNIRISKFNYKGFSIDKDLFFYNVSERGMLRSVSLSKFKEIYQYIRNKHKELFLFKNLIKIYFKYRKIPSTHKLELYFIYNLFYYFLEAKLFNNFLKLSLIFFSHSKSQNKLKINLIREKNVIKKIAHVITSLELGGAEKSFFSLLNGLKKNNKINNIVICLKGRSYFSQKLEKLGIKIYHLNMKPNRLNIASQIKLYKIIKNEQINLIQSWMYHADLVSTLAGFFNNCKVFWSIHNYNISIKALGLQTRFVVFLCALLSHIFPSKMISVSQAAIKKHINVGYNKKKFLHINLGYKNTKFSKPVKKNREKIILGSLSRWNVQKNHTFMINSLGLFKKKYKIKFILMLAGTGLVKKNLELVNLIKKNNLTKQVILLGRIENIKAFFSRIDLYISTSIGEAFPNAICEAMLHQIPVITSDVGDVSNIIGHTGWLHSVNDYKSLESSLLDAYEQKKIKDLWKARKYFAQERIINNFSMDTMINHFYKAWNNDFANERLK